MLKNRLLAIGVTLFLLGVTAVVYSGGTILPLCALIFSVLCISFCTVRFLNNRLRYAIIFSIIPIIGMAYTFIYRNISIIPMSVYDEKQDNIIATVDTVYSSGYIVTVNNSEAGLPKGEKIYAVTDAKAISGDKVFISGKTEYSDEKWLYADAKLTVKPTVFNVTEGEGLGYVIRKQAYKYFDSLDLKYGSFLKSVIFNDKSDFEDERYYIYRNAGAAPFFAVSGLHVSILVMTVFNVLGFFRVNKYAVAVISIAIGVLYGFLIGFSPSVFRAVVMVVFVISSKLLSVDSDGITSLFFALFVLLLINPFSVSSLSLQLSFLATLGMLYCSSFTKQKSKKRPILSMLIGIFVVPIITSLTCFVFTLPISMFSFGAVSLASPISNTVLAVIFSPLLILAFLVTLLASLNLTFFSWLFFPLSVLIDVFDFVCALMSSTPSFLLTTNNAFAVCSSVIAVIIIFVLLVCTNKRASVISFAISCVLIVCICVSGIIVMQRSNLAKSEVIYSKSYDGSAVISLIGGKRTYIDCGGGFDAEALYQNNITALDTYVIINCDGDIEKELLFAVNVFNVSEILVPHGAYFDILQSNPELSPIVKGYSDITLGDYQKGVLIDDKEITLYSSDYGFVISLTGRFFDGLTYSGMIFEKAPYSVPSSVIYTDSVFFLPSGVDAPSEMAPFTRLTENGSVIKAIILPSGEIEVSFNEH